MDLLKEEFLDQLRAEIDEKTGKVIIEAAEFTPQQILQDISETTFTEVFTEWCENRRQEKLDKADEILAKFGNEKRFRVIKSRFESGAIIPFVGAGMSMPSGYPSWTEFLYRLIDETTADKDQFFRFMESWQYEEAAQYIFDNMGEARFNEELENEFGHDALLLGAVRFLPKLFKSSVITTNYDNVIKRCYETEGKPFSDTLIGSEAIELPKLLGEEKNVLLKLHGKSNSSRNRILTLSEYKEHYENNDQLKKCIKALSTKTLLFMGCSLGTDRTVQALIDIVNESDKGSLPKHYAFLRLNDEKERVEKAEQLAKANIYPIWYTDDHDESIEALLEKLAEGVNQ
ncbi:SIR2 family protein [Vibrio vulnificus]|nr:SIR2 family protein [Vibrio vulnificus]